MTSEDYQRYVRIAFYFVTGNLVQRGYMSDGSVELYAGIVLFAANILWSMYGMRLQAKLAEITKYGEVKQVVSTKQIADIDMANNAKIVSSH